MDISHKCSCDSNDSLSEQISQLRTLLMENGINAHFSATFHVDLWPSYDIGCTSDQSKDVDQILS